MKTITKLEKEYITWVRRILMVIGGWLLMIELPSWLAEIGYNSAAVIIACAVYGAIFLYGRIKEKEYMNKRLNENKSEID